MTHAGSAAGRAKYVLTRHDDGAWYRARLLDQWRAPDGRWRCSIMYYVGVGEQYSRAVWAGELRRVEGEG